MPNEQVLTVLLRNRTSEEDCEYMPTFQLLAVLPSTVMLLDEIRCTPLLFP